MIFDNAGSPASRAGSVLLIAALITAAAVTGLCVYTSVRGFYHEDAYILFTYSRNLASGAGIVWSELSGPAEGATDFLWMLLISGLLALHIPVNWAVAILSGIGAALYVTFSMGLLRASLSQHEHAAEQFRKWTLPLLALLIAGIALPLASTLGGFSTVFTMGILSAALYAAALGRVWAPAIALALALVRPEQVPVACALTVVGFIATGKRSKFIVVALAAALVGAGYFAWRWKYFGLPFPLPFYVKIASSPGVLKGLLPTTLFFLEHEAILIGALVAAATIALGSRALTSSDVMSKTGKFAALGLIAVLAINVLVLCMTHQSQNIRFRFQIPAWYGAMMLTLLVATTVATRRASAERSDFRNGGALAGAAVLSVVAVQMVMNLRYPLLEFGTLTRPDYMNHLPQQIREWLPAGTRTVVTEAGRMGYFLPGQKLDMVGLNSPQIAVNRPSTASLREFRPHLIYFDTSEVVGTADVPHDPPYVKLSKVEFLERTRKVNPARESNERVAARALVDYIVSTDDCDEPTVALYDGKMQHIWTVCGMDETATFIRSHLPESLHKALVAVR